jgi:hypothetical protein
MRYSYTQRDLLEGEPYHYMYSPFEGPEFLQAYTKSRELTLKSVGAHAEAGRADRKISLPMPDPNGSGIQTSDILSDMVDYLRSGETAALALKAWVELFVRKFEVSKRLRRAYGRHFSVVDATSVARMDYARLAFAVAKTIEGPHQLRLLNTLLKLIDLVLSGGPLDAETAALMAPSIELELKLVRGLSAHLRIKLPETAAC